MVNHRKKFKLSNRKFKLSNPKMSNTHAVALGPSTTHATPGPSTTHAISSGPPTTHATSSGPSTTHATSPGPPTTHATSSGPPTTHATSSGPSTTHAASSGPSTTHTTSSGPSTTHTTSSGPPTTHATSLGPYNIKKSMFFQDITGSQSKKVRTLLVTVELTPYNIRKSMFFIHPLFLHQSKSLQRKSYVDVKSLYSFVKDYNEIGYSNSENYIVTKLNEKMSLNEVVRQRDITGSQSKKVKALLVTVELTPYNIRKSMFFPIEI
ncbi:hypothetical protein ACTA71_006915 [Dictyostelium dimigraforme]